jgi:hypothetical protein
MSGREGNYAIFGVPYSVKFTRETQRKRLLLAFVDQRA